MRSVNFSDTDLILGLISQDSEILRAYYRLFYGGTRRYVLSNNGNEEDAKDVFQDTLLVLFQKARTKDFKLTCALGTYLNSVSRYLWLKELSKRKWIARTTEVSESFIDLDEDVVSLHEKNERLIFYHKCFDNLSEDCRKVLKFFSEGMSIAQITSAMGYKSEQHTKNRKYRCKHSLISIVRKQYNDDKSGYGNN